MGKYQLPNIRISSDWQDHKDRTPPSKEPGTDFALAYGSAIYAPYDGTVRVVQSSNANATGRYIGIDLSDGNYFRALHLSSIAVKAGQKVKKGQLIAHSGASAWGKDWGVGAHVHMSLWVGTDPLKSSFTNTRDIVAYSNAGSPTGTSSEYPALDRYSKDWVVEGQKLLIKIGYNLGSWGADGKDGATTQSAVRDFQNKNGLEVDGILGENTMARLKAQVAAGHPVFPLPAGWYFGPESGPKESVSGYHGYSAPLGVWQQRMKDRGWDITPDGKYGDETGSIALQFQTEKNLTPDKLIGKQTWDAAWTAPVTPAGTTPTKPADPAPTAPAATPRTPVYPKAIRGWNVPLATARTKDAAITWLILHHQASTNDDEAYFKTKNDRSSCPTWQVKANGDVVELIPPNLKPSSSGGANNMSVAIETQNTSMAPNWGISKESHEAIAQILFWLYNQASIGGVPVRIKLDRNHVFGDREITAKTGIAMRATACPGPSMDMDWIVNRAKELAEAATPTPDPTPDPTPIDDTVSVKRSWLQAVADKIKSLLAQ